MDYKKIEDKFSKNIDDFDVLHASSLEKIFVSQREYEKHLSKRILLGHVNDDIDYAIKTFSALSDCTSSYLERHKSLHTWDRIIYDAKSQWIVIVSEHGRIITSYAMYETLDELLQKRAEVSDEISEEGEGDELRAKAEAIRDRLRILYDR